MKRKLTPCYIGPFKIVAKHDAIAYKLKLPSSLSNVQDVFHISQPKKCFRVPTETIAVDTLDPQPNLSYIEYPLRKHTIKFVKLNNAHENALCMIIKLAY